MSNLTPRDPRHAANKQTPEGSYEIVCVTGIVVYVHCIPCNGRWRRPYAQNEQFGSDGIQRSPENAEIRNSASTGELFGNIRWFRLQGNFPGHHPRTDES